MKTEPMVPDKDQQCPVTHCLAVIGGKWKPIILFAITNGVDRFGVLRRTIPGITKQMLTQQLRELEADGILNRKVYAEIPPRVEYSITKRGKSLLTVVKAMKAWGEADFAAMEKAEKARSQLDLPL